MKGIFTRWILCLLFALEPAFGESIFPWGEWEFLEDMAQMSDGKDQLRVDGWKSGRLVGDYMVFANLVPGPDGVGCLVTYNDCEDDDAQWIVCQPISAKPQLVKVYPGLPPAMSNCRTAIEEQIELSPAPVSTASDEGGGHRTLWQESTTGVEEVQGDHY